MFYRDMTRAAPTSQPEVDLVSADGAALDALTVYLMRYEHIRERTACGSRAEPRVNPLVAPKVKPRVPTVPPTVHAR